MQAAIGYPLTVHGTGGQTRAFIHIRDSVKCVQLALENPPETGERVNIMFAEDSWLTQENGRDMMWNPTSNIVTEQFPFYSSQTQEISGGNYLLGGKHFIYVINGQSWVKGTEDYVNGDFSDVDNSPNYDDFSGKALKKRSPYPAKGAFGTF